MMCFARQAPDAVAEEHAIGDDKRGQAMALRWLLAAAFLVPLGVLAAAKPPWETVVAFDPLQDRTACLLESAPVVVNDGQTMTPVRFTYNGEAFLVTTESNIDVSYPGIGLQVDGQTPIPIEQVHNDTNVIFASDAAKIKAQFIHGSRAQLSLGFWPTWPKGETVVAEFSLAGFTRAHDKFTQCQQTGFVRESPKQGAQP
jgi:hypothetical protein